MATRSTVRTDTQWSGWVKTGLMAALFSVVAVLVVQAVALSIWPEAALFKPLESYPRSALFTLIPALGATAVFAWLVRRQERPLEKFLMLSAVVLLLSVIPDYALQVPAKSLSARSIAAFMHLTAGVVTVGAIAMSYRSTVGL